MWLDMRSCSRLRWVLQVGTRQRRKPKATKGSRGQPHGMGTEEENMSGLLGTKIEGSTAHAATYCCTQRGLKRTTHCTAHVRGCNASVQCTPFRKVGRDAEKTH